MNQKALGDSALWACIMQMDATRIADHTHSSQRPPVSLQQRSPMSHASLMCSYCALDLVWDTDAIQ